MGCKFDVNEQCSQSVPGCDFLFYDKDGPHDLVALTSMKIVVFDKPKGPSLVNPSLCVSVSHQRV